jgi:steroid delta-isomerase-like uncharacterized protein
MSEENKAIMGRLYDEVFNKGDWAAVDVYVAPDVVDHNRPPGVSEGIEGFKQFLAMFRTAFPDVEVVIEHMVAEGDRVVAQVTWQGTHLGEFIGIPPTGKRVKVVGVDVVRISGGKCVEFWGNFDEVSIVAFGEGFDY